MNKHYQVIVEIELSGMDEDYEPTRNDADQVVETALSTLYNNGLNDGDLSERIVFDGYPSIKVVAELPSDG